MSSIAVAPSAGSFVGAERLTPVHVAPEVSVVSELRLTRRGRLLVLVLGLVAVFAAGLLLSGVSVASQSSVGYPTRVVMVAPGDTLWEIADDAAGSGSTREMVTTIERLNDLTGGGVQAGQRLVVPLR